MGCKCNLIKTMKDLSERLSEHEACESQISSRDKQAQQVEGLPLESGDWHVEPQAASSLTHVKPKVPLAVSKQDMSTVFTLTLNS